MKERKEQWQQQGSPLYKSNELTIDFVDGRQKGN